MGVDFVDKVKRQFKKKIDRGAVELNTSDLFTKQPGIAQRTIVLTLTDNCSVREGELLILQSSGNELVARRDNMILGHSGPLDQITMDAFAGSCGIACGKVHNFFPISMTVEVTIATD